MSHANTDKTHCKRGHPLSGDNLSPYTSHGRRCKACAQIREAEFVAAQGNLNSVWRGMIARCTNPKSNSYQYYGARGITVCEEWRTYAAFRKDMAPRPKGATLDRKDNDGPYCKDNCRWATPKEQTATRRNRYRTHCPNGHEYSPENTLLITGEVHRNKECRICKRARYERWEQNKRGGESHGRN